MVEHSNSHLWIESLLRVAESNYIWWSSVTQFNPDMKILRYYFDSSSSYVVLERGVGLASSSSHRLVMLCDSLHSQ